MPNVLGNKVGVELAMEVQGSASGRECKWRASLFQSSEIDQSFQGLEFIVAWCRCRSRSMYNPLGMELAASSPGESSLPWQLLLSP